MQRFLDTFIHRTLRRPYRLRVTFDSGKGQPIIFLHGIASSSLTWQHVLPLIAPDYRVITIDLLGFGNSPKPDWSVYSLTDHANAVAKTIKKLHLGQSAIIVGHSMGSLVAVELAKHYPKQVKRLVLCSMPLYINKDVRKNVDYSKSDQLINNLYFKIYQFISERPDFTLKNAERIKKLGGENTGFVLSEQTWVSFVKSLQNTIEGQTTITDIKALSLPIDIVYGTLDMLVISGYLKDVARDKPNIQLHKTISGHEITPKYGAKIAAIVNKA